METLQTLTQLEHTIEAGIKTAFEFSTEQRYKSMETVQKAQVTKPALRLNGETVVVSMRSKTHSVIVSIRNTTGKPIVSFPPKFTHYINTAMDLSKDDMATISANLGADPDLKVGTPEHKRLETEWSDAWVEHVCEVLKGSHPDGGMEKRLLGHACLAMSTAWNTLMATLMLEAMEEAEEEGLRLCYANRAKVFHAHAGTNRGVLDLTWKGAMEMKVVVL